MGQYFWPNKTNVVNTVAIPVSVAAFDSSFKVDAVSTFVSEDTVTPANSVPLPVKALDGSGVEIDFATEAKQDSQITELQAIKTAVEAIDDAISGTEMQVDVVSSALPSGAASETTLAAIDTKLAGTIAVSIDAGLNNIGVVNIADTNSNGITSGNYGARQGLHVNQLGRNVQSTARHDYGVTPVTTGAWVELLSSVGFGEILEIEIFDSSGQTLELGTGAALSETRLLLIFPGGNGRVSVRIPTTTRLAIRAVSGTANAGELCMNLYGSSAA